jgi:hypothetical protein
MTTRRPKGSQAVSVGDFYVIERIPPSPEWPQGAWRARSVDPLLEAAAPNPRDGRPDRWCRRCGAALIECPCCAAVFCPECRTLSEDALSIQREEDYGDGA